MKPPNYTQLSPGSDSGSGLTNPIGVKPEANTGHVQDPDHTKGSILSHHQTPKDVSDPHIDAQQPPPQEYFSNSNLVKKEPKNSGVIDDRDNECTICLEPILDSDQIGIIPSCCAHNKVYHDRCIVQWSTNSNSCPTCRRLFHKVEIYDKNQPLILKRVVPVQDKLLPNDAINHIPREYVIPASNSDSYSEIRQNDTTSGICSICSSSDYLSSVRNMMSCNFCGSSFHLDCIGISSDTDISNWCCPICDIDQELILPFTRRTARTHIQLSSERQRVNTTQRLRTGFSIFGNSTRTTRNTSRPGLIIHNENNELDDDFLYDNGDDEFNYEQPEAIGYHPVINGGVLLRKELRAQQNLSKDELQSWQVFEVARSQENEPIVTGISQEETISPPEFNGSNKRRRRKRITPINEAITGSSRDLRDTPSRISSLISQLKTSPPPRHSNIAKRPAASGLVPPPPPLTTFGSPESLGSMSPASTSPMDPGINDSDTQYDSDSRLQKKPKSVELTLDQKIEIQKYIRANLRELYRPNEQSPGLITSEEDYIIINKTISRKIYGHILSEANEDLPTVIEKYFNGDDISKLKDLVDTHAKTELDIYRKDKSK